MTRKQYVHSTTIGHDPTEILPQNNKRISATLYFDANSSSTIVALGNSGQAAKDGNSVTFYYFPFIWYGINPLWVATPTTGDIKQPVTIVELVDE